PPPAPHTLSLHDALPILPVPYFEYTDEDRAAFRANPELIDAIRYNEEYWENIYRFNRALVDPTGPDMQQIQDIVRENLENSVKRSEEHTSELQSRENLVC